MGKQKIDPKVKAQRALDVAQRKLDAAEKKKRDLAAQLNAARAEIEPLKAQRDYLAANPLLAPAPEPQADAAPDRRRRAVVMAAVGSVKVKVDPTYRVSVEVALLDEHGEWKNDVLNLQLSGHDVRSMLSDACADAPGLLRAAL